MEKTVGIIANPASGRDIRRLVAHGSVFDNQEKINIIRRVLKALDEVDVDRVFIMPDFAGLGIRALEDLDLSLQVSLLDMEAQGTQNDSSLAAALMVKMGVGCLITLGGDGTNRVVAKTCGETPLVPISCGTNNVFPYLVEGTVAGLAAGLVATGQVETKDVGFRAPRLEILQDGELKDVALVDVVVTDDLFTGVRAIWDVDKVKEIFLARSKPSATGFSAVGGYVCPLPFNSGLGLHLVLGPGRKRVKSAIAPGHICWVPIASYQKFGVREEIAIQSSPAMIALDGEREIAIRPGEKWSVRINPAGPWVVDIEKAVETGCTCCLFHEEINQ
ncbi:MAG: NAD(+)/NADH kinase [Deltaproteobacteria bacterium]|nr:NAD(+)/NADH kinase [Deltaproteobacteria bacterium]